MGLVKKADLEKYWNMNSKTRIPFFGKYMSCNRFQSILWNFHVNDDSLNPHCTHPQHDPLCKIRPFVEMCERNFLYAYKPSKSLSFDEACCPFKGCLRFKVYNPQKPNRTKLSQLYQRNPFKHHLSQGSLKGTFLNTCQKEMERFNLYCAKLAILLPRNYLKWVIPKKDCHLKQVFIGVKSANHHCA